MGFFNILFIGFGLAMDAFAVIVAKSLLIEKVRFRESFKIAFVFSFFQGLMPIIGWSIGLNFGDMISRVDYWISFLVLFFIGGRMLFNALGDEDHNASSQLSVLNDKSKKNKFTLDLLIILSIITSIDALVVGVSFAFLNISIIYASSIITTITFILCFLAVYIGKTFGDLVGTKAEILGGVILILIGLKIFLEHLFQ